VFKQGDTGTEWYAIYRGSVDVAVSKTGNLLDSEVVCTLGQGYAFGEMAILNNQPRYAQRGPGESYAWAKTLTRPALCCAAFARVLACYAQSNATITAREDCDFVVIRGEVYARVNARRQAGRRQSEEDDLADDISSLSTADDTASVMSPDEEMTPRVR